MTDPEATNDFDVRPEDDLDAREARGEYDGDLHGYGICYSCTHRKGEITASEQQLIEALDRLEGAAREYRRSLEHNDPETIASWRGLFAYTMSDTLTHLINP